MTDVIKELEDSWGIQRDLWDLEQWKAVAILCATSYYHTPEFEKTLAQISENNADLHNHFVQLSEASKDLYKTQNESFLYMQQLVHKLQQQLLDAKRKKPAGRRPKPKPTRETSVKPKQTRGRATKFNLGLKITLINKADSIKREQNLKSDIDAMRYFCRNVTPKEKRTATVKFAKLLSRFRKEIQN